MSPSKTVAELIEESLAVERHHADMAAALKLARQAQALADESEQIAEMAAARVAVARFRFRMGQYETAKDLAQQALSLTSPPNDETAAVHADALIMLGMCAGESASLDDAETVLLKGADLAREIGHPVLLLRALHNLAVLVYTIRGQFSLALAADEEARQIAHHHDLKEWLYFPLISLAWNLQITGEVVRSRTVLDELQQVAPPDTSGGAYSAYIGALLDMDEGSLETVPDQLRRVRTVAERTGDPALNVEVRLGMCRYHRLSGNLGKAWEWAEDALLVARRNRYPIKVADSLLEHGWVNWLRGHCDAAEADWRQAADLYRLNKANYSLAYLSLLQAALLHQQKRPDAAQAWLECTRLVRANEYSFLLDRERALAYPLIAAYLNHPDGVVAEASAALLDQIQRTAPFPLRIHLLGEFQVWQGKRRIGKQELRRRRAGELLGLLLITPGHTLPAEQAAEALSPEIAPDAGRTVIHHATSELRRLLEPELPDRRFPSRYLEVTEHLIRLHLPAGSWWDVKAFEQAVRAHDWELALELYGGEFLPEYRYADWAVARRESLAEDYRQVLLELAERRVADQDWSAALDFARRLIALDPWHEGAVLVAMRACQALNDLSAARRWYKRLERTLAEDLGVEPQVELQTLYRSLDKRRR